MGEPLKITFHFQLQTQIPCQTTAKMKETHLSWSRGRVHCDITSPLGSFFPVLLLYFFISCWWLLQYVETFADHITFLKTYQSQYDIFKTFIFEALTRRKLRSTAYLEELRWVTTQKTHCNWTLKNCMMNYKTNCTALWT